MNEVKFKNGSYLRPILEKEIELNKDLSSYKEEQYSKLDELVLDVSVPKEVAKHIYERDLTNPNLDKAKVEETYKKSIEKIDNEIAAYSSLIKERKDKEKSSLNSLISKNEALIASNKGFEQTQIKENEARLELIELKNKEKQETKAKKEASKKEKIQAKLDVKKKNLEKQKEQAEFLDSIKKSRSIR